MQTSFVMAQNSMMRPDSSVDDRKELCEFLYYFCSFSFDNFQKIQLVSVILHNRVNSAPLPLRPSTYTQKHRCNEAISVVILSTFLFSRTIHCFWIIRSAFVTHKPTKQSTLLRYCWPHFHIPVFFLCLFEPVHIYHHRLFYSITFVDVV